MIPHDDGYRPVVTEGEEPYIDWFRGGACGISVSGLLFRAGLLPLDGAGKVDKDWDKDCYILLPKPLCYLFRWIPWWNAPHYERYPWFYCSLRAPKWELWYAKPGCFGFRYNVWGGFTRYSREVWEEKAAELPPGTLAPYPRFGICW